MDSRKQVHSAVADVDAQPLDARSAMADKDGHDNRVTVRAALALVAKKAHVATKIAARRVPAKITEVQGASSPGIPTTRISQKPSAILGRLNPPPTKPGR
jgi:hypothetical protein